MIPAGTLPCLGPSLQGDIPGISHSFLTASSREAGPADLCVPPWGQTTAWPSLEFSGLSPLPGPLQLLPIHFLASLLAEGLGILLKWGGDQHSSQLAVFLPNGTPPPATPTCLQLNGFWTCPWQLELRACDATWAEFLPRLQGKPPTAHFIQGPGNPPCPASHPQPEAKHHLSRFLCSSSALLPFPQMGALRKVSRAWN